MWDNSGLTLAYTITDTPGPWNPSQPRHQHLPDPGGLVIKDLIRKEIAHMPITETLQSRD